MSLQFGIKEVANFSLFNYITGAPILYTDYAMSFDLDAKGTRIDLRGGQGNYQLMGFDHTKVVSCKVKVPLVDFNMLAVLTGRPINTGSVQAPQRDLLYTVTGNTITLTQTPVAGTLQIYLSANSGNRDLGVLQTLGSASVANQYSIVGNVVTLNAASAPVGQAIICYYDFMTLATANRITLSASDFPAYVRMTGDGLMTDEITTAITPIKFNIFKAKVQPTWTITLESTKPTELDLAFDLYVVPDTTNNGLLTYFTMTEIIAAVTSTVAPAVTQVAPGTGSHLGSTPISVYGSGFTGGSAAVKINNIACTAVNVNSDGEIVCLTGATTAGTYAVIVTTTNGSSSATITAANQFIYV